MRIALTLTLMLIFASSVSLISQEAIAMRSKTKGFSVNANAAYLAYTGEEQLLHPNPQYGFGVGGQIQYGITHQIALAVGYQAYKIKTDNEYVIDPYSYTEIDLLFKYTLGSTSSPFRSNLIGLVNFVNTEQSFYDAQFNDYYETFFSGISFGGGAGIAYFFAPQISAELSLFYQFTQLTEQEQSSIFGDFTYDIDIPLRSYKGLLGLAYHF